MPKHSLTNKKRRQDVPEDKDMDNTKKPRITQRTSLKGTSNFRPFACPYYKIDPLVHQKCSNYQDKGLGHLKQHIRRRHNQAAFCPICGDTFEDTASLNKHIRRRSCQPNAFFLEPDGTTPEQREALSKRIPATLSREDQWFSVFDIVCPGYQSRPVSPYHETAMCEATLTYIRNNGPRVFIASLQQEVQWPQELDPSAIEPVLSQVLTHTLEQLAANMPSSEHRQGNDKGMSTEPSLGAESSESIAFSLHHPRIAEACSCSIAQIPQPKAACEHHEATTVNMVSGVMGVQGDDAHLRMSDRFPYLTNMLDDSLAFDSFEF